MAHADLLSPEPVTHPDPHPFAIAGREFRSRLMVGTGKYASNAQMIEAIEASGAEVVTVAVRRVDLDRSKDEAILHHLDPDRFFLLANTAGCYTAADAIRYARLARAAGFNEWVKLEVIGDQQTLLPDTAGLLEATKFLVDDGFKVLAYTNDDLVTALKLEQAGAVAVMPLASPIGSGLGMLNPYAIRTIKQRLSVPVIVDAGVGTASDACIVMEQGVDGILMNTGIAAAQDPVRMASAMRGAVEAGRQAYLAGRMPRREVSGAVVANDGNGGDMTALTTASVAAVTAARAVAAEICVDLRRGEFLDQSFDRRIAPLDARDRRWTRELVYGMLRHRGWIDSILSDRVRGGLVRLDPDVIDLLRLGVYQLTRMGSVPAYAAIAQTVELAKRRHGLGASKLVNAVLRRTDRERDDLNVMPATDAAEALALKHSHPRWLVARWIERWGEQETERLLTLNNAEAPIVIRPYGIVREQLEANLEEAGVHVAESPYVPESIAISGGITLTELGAFKKGLFFVQDPAATLVTEYAAIHTGATVADLCAAPGGKSLELSRHANAVYAGDKSVGRLQRLLANQRRLETTNIHAFVADARHPAIRPVDAVLIDVPCTGTGTFRRHPDARWRIKISDFAVMAALQKTIIRSAAQVVRPGGLMVYSTCSLEPEENDDQVASFLAENLNWILEPPPEGSVAEDLLDRGKLRVLPHRHNTDGAFAARLRRVS